MIETIQDIIRRIEENQRQQKERVDAILANSEASSARWKAMQEADRRSAEERQRRRDARTLLEYAVPNFAAPLRRLREAYDEEVGKVRSDSYLSEEGKSRKLAELSEAHRREVREEVEVVRDRMNSYLSRYRAIAKVDDEPQDELRYSRLEREFMAKVRQGRIPDLASYLDAIESGDRDLVRVVEVHAPLYIEDVGKRNEFNAEVENQRQARLSDEQKLARQRVRELQAKRDDFELGLRHGAFDSSAREVA